MSGRLLGLTKNDLECTIPKFKVEELERDSVPVVGLAALEDYCKEHKYYNDNPYHDEDSVYVEALLVWARLESGKK